MTQAVRPPDKKASFEYFSEGDYETKESKKTIRD
jgi:hypothetical protein